MLALSPRTGLWIELPKKTPKRHQPQVLTNKEQAQEVIRLDLVYPSPRALKGGGTNLLTTNVTVFCCVHRPKNGHVGVRGRSAAAGGTR